jgi:hypothetical protein
MRVTLTCRKANKMLPKKTWARVNSSGIGTSKEARRGG